VDVRVHRCLDGVDSVQYHGLFDSIRAFGADDSYIERMNL
jgi:hypothetical protein